MIGSRCDGEIRVSALLLTVSESVPYRERRVLALESDKRDSCRVLAVVGREEQGQRVDGRELGRSKQRLKRRRAYHEPPLSVILSLVTHRTASSITSRVTATSKLCVASKLVA